jgi:CheY-like chemotaxis protein
MLGSTKVRLPAHPKFYPVMSQLLISRYRVQLIHWNPTEAQNKAKMLKDAGYVVIQDAPNNIQALRKLGEDPPKAFVIDLSRLPSQGRDIALAIRLSKKTRQVPLVFVEGELEKVERIKRLLPDAIYTTWSQIRSSLKRAIAHPPVDPVVPESIMDSYHGASLSKKLGIKVNSKVVLVNAPKNFEKTLGELPDGARIFRRNSGPRDLTIWFTKSVKDLEGRIERISSGIGKGGLWIAWPKKASGVGTDISQNHVREVGLSVGLVDYKVCSIDTTWSGLLFTRRKTR